MPLRSGRDVKPVINPGLSTFETLPDEFLQSLYDLLDSFETPGLYFLRPLSKHLSVFSTRCLYRRIAIETVTNLGQLCTTLLSKPILFSFIIELIFEGKGISPIKNPTLAWMIPNQTEQVLIQSIHLKKLEVRNWNFIGALVLSNRFGQHGKALQVLVLTDCFGEVEGNLVKAWSHLAGLPSLIHIDYFNAAITRSYVDPGGEDVKPLLRGFARLTKLTVWLADFSSPHAQAWSSLTFPSVRVVELISIGKQAPNYEPFLQCLPSTVERLTLSLDKDLNFTGRHFKPISLKRFTRLNKLSFEDHRSFTSEQVQALLQVPSLISLDLFTGCRITPALLEEFLSEISRLNPNFKNFYLGSSLKRIGQIGIKCKEGGKLKLDLDSNNLVPGIGWIKPLWSNEITFAGAERVERLCRRNGVVLGGPVAEALAVERKFEEEEEWLENTMKCMRTGRID